MQDCSLFEMNSEVERELFLVKYREENYAFDQEISQETKRISFLISASVTHFTLASMSEVGSEWMLLLMLLEV